MTVTDIFTWLRIKYFLALDGKQKVKERVILDMSSQQSDTASGESQQQSKSEFSQNPFPIVGIIVIAVVFLINFFFTYYTKQKNTDNTVQIYFADNIDPIDTIIINQFNKEYMGRIKVNPVDLSFSKFSTNERKEILIRSFRSKSERLDIISVDCIWVPKFAKWCEPLNSFVSESLLDSMLSYALHTCYYDSTLYAIPLSIDLSLMYVRKDLIEKLPDGEQWLEKITNSITWKDLIALKQKYFPNNKAFYSFYGEAYEGLMCSYYETLLNLDRDILSDEEYYHSGVSKKTIQHYYDLVHTLDISPPEVVNFKEGSATDAFLNKGGVFVRGWPVWPDYVSDIEKTVGPNAEIIRVPLPHFDGDRRTSIFGGWNMMISKNSEHKTEAIIFAKYLMQKSVQQQMYEYAQNPPILKSFYEDSLYVSEHPDLAFYWNNFPHGVWRPQVKDYTRVSDILSYYINRVLKQEMVLDDALQQAHLQILSGKPLIRN